MRHVTRQRIKDGGLHLSGPIAFEQPLQANGDGAQIGAAFGGADQQVLAGRSSLDEAIGGAVLASGMLALDQGLNVGGILDLRAPRLRRGRPLS